MEHPPACGCDSPAAAPAAPPPAPIARTAPIRATPPSSAKIPPNRATATNPVTKGGSTLQNLTHAFSATQNNGQILSQADALSGETVGCAYDALNRLATAASTGPQWGLQVSYDGFGNRANQAVTKGSGPAHSVAVDRATNRILAEASPRILSRTQTVTYPTEQELIKRCSLERTLVEPATGQMYRGGMGYEREHMWDPSISGLSVYTMHWMLKAGAVVHGPHVRPGSPKGGGSGG